MTKKEEDAAVFVPPGSVPIETVFRQEGFEPQLPDIETWRDVTPEALADSAKSTAPAKSATKKEN